MKIRIFETGRGWRIPRRRIAALARRILRSERTAFKEINLIIADDRYLRDLNRRYFKKDRPTNVIAFDLGQMAEVYLSRDQVFDPDELLYVVAHGLLHLAGYDHRSTRDQARMDRRCRRYSSHG